MLSQTLGTLPKREGASLSQKKVLPTRQQPSSHRKVKENAIRQTGVPSHTWSSTARGAKTVLPLSSHKNLPSVMPQVFTGTELRVLQKCTHQDTLGSGLWTTGTQCLPEGIRNSSNLDTPNSLQPSLPANPTGAASIKNQVITQRTCCTCMSFLHQAVPASQTAPTPC